MPLILNIDTATEVASICLSRDGDIIGYDNSIQQKDHASWIHPAIKNMLEKSAHPLRDVQAIAVTIGPGSYTGLRVGLATAKGICYAMKIPLVTENTLRVMALASKHSFTDLQGEAVLHCPMIDARRMEVFTALYSGNLEEVLTPRAVTLTADILDDHLGQTKIVFSGSGRNKFKAMLHHQNAIFSDLRFSAIHLADLARRKFLNDQFDDIAYTEPLYLKEFYTVPKK